MRLLFRVAIVSTLAATTVPASAQDGWNPFAKPDEPSRRSGSTPQQPPADARPPLNPMEGLSRWLSGKSDVPASRPVDPAMDPPSPGRGTGEPAWREAMPPPAPLDSRSRAVQIEELAPPVAADGSGLPYDMWQGLDLARLEQLMAEIAMPPRSPALGILWRRLLTADVSAPSGTDTAMFEGLRLEALYRSGMIKEMAELISRQPAPRAPIVAVMDLRLAIARSRAPESCAGQRDTTARRAELPPPLRAEVLMIGGYCAALAGNPSAAGLAADLAREEGAQSGYALALLDSIALGRKSAGALPARIGALEYRLLEAMDAPEKTTALARADAAVLTALAGDTSAPPEMQVAAAEAAARLSAMTGEQLADVWRRVPADPSSTDPGIRRASAFKAAEAERTPQRKARAIRGLLDEARRADLYLAAAGALERATADVTITPEIGWFAETAIEVMLLAGRYGDVRRIAGVQGLDRGNEQLGHWLALADIADPGFSGRRGESLASVEALALRGRFVPDVLHRLATVLDALDYNVPIPLWEAASRTPQPTGGYLPDTGVLSELQDAARKKQFGRTVMLAMRALGPDGPERANILALGDAMRALRRAGFESDARRIGLEALFAAWPRSTGN